MEGSGAVRYRNMTLGDVPVILKLEAECFPGIPPDRHWQPDMLRAHVKLFPEGQWVAEMGGRIVGSATNLRVPLEDALRHHTWREIAGGGYLTTHDPRGSALYGTEVMVHPDARRRGIARALYGKRKALARDLNMRAFVTGGRIPGYEKHAHRMDATAYVKQVVAGKLEDRTLTPQLRSGLTVAGVMSSYITDPRSHNHATLLVWWNLDYQPSRSLTPAGAAAPAASSRPRRPGAT